MQKDNLCVLVPVKSIHLNSHYVNKTELITMNTSSIFFSHN